MKNKFAVAETIFIAAEAMLIAGVFILSIYGLIKINQATGAAAKNVSSKIQAQGAFDSNLGQISS